MKKPSQNVSASLRGQNVGGRKGETPMVSKQGRVKGVTTIPGEGGVEMAPGGMPERSAAHFTAPMSRYGGK